MEIHETGYAWRFIRRSFLSFNLALFLTKSHSGASMTLVGLLPPLCDNGNMLVDGGYCEFHAIAGYHLEGTHAA